MDKIPEDTNSRRFVVANWHWRGELVGPHGTGKSTLLTDICDHATAAGLKITRWQCG